MEDSFKLVHEFNQQQNLKKKTEMNSSISGESVSYEDGSAAF